MLACIAEWGARRAYLCDSTVANFFSFCYVILLQHRDKTIKDWQRDYFGAGKRVYYTYTDKN